MFQENQQIGVYRLELPIKRGDFSEVWVASMRDATAPHENIYWLIEFGQVNGQIAILSEYPGADSLADKLETQPNFSTKQAIKLTIGILDGLDHLHKKGIIHGKLNPRNIFLQNETPVLADFGFLDDGLDDDPEYLPPTDRLFYLAPEAFDGNCSVQTDIWSVGAILYQLLSGKLPFPQEGIGVIFAILKSDFSPLPDEIPIWLKEIVGRALAKNPESRYQSTEAMSKDLSWALDSINNSSFLRPSFPELMYPGALVVDGIRSHGATGGSVSEIAVAFDSPETVVAFYEEKFGIGQVKSDYGAVVWSWEDNIGSLKGYNTVSVYPESSITSLTEQHSLEIPANTRAIIFIYSEHW